MGPKAVDAHQFIAIERYLDATKPICSPHITTDVGTDPKLGIEADIAKWCRALRRLSPPHSPSHARCRYLDSHLQTQDAAKSSGQAVAAESAGNGWTYADADILGMVQPLNFAVGDRFAFVQRSARRLTRQQRD